MTPLLQAFTAQIQPVRLLLWYPPITASNALTLSLRQPWVIPWPRPPSAAPHDRIFDSYRPSVQAGRLKALLPQENVLRGSGSFAVVSTRQFVLTRLPGQEQGGLGRHVYSRKLDIVR